MSVVVVFPRNNPFSKKNTRPVVLAASPYILKSSLNVKVISPFTDTPIENVDVTIISKKNSTKKAYPIFILEQKYLKEAKLIEVHQDIKLAALIKKKYPEKKVFVIKHCRVLVNKLLENTYLFRYLFYHKYIKNLDGIYCVSNYVKNLFIKKYPKAEKKFMLLYNTYGHIENVINHNSDKKDNLIVFAGKPVKQKGFVEFGNAVVSILNKYKNYKILIISAFFSEKKKYKTEYIKFSTNKEVIKLIEEGRIIIKSNLNVEAVFEEMSRARILVVPSKVEEGFGFVSLEAAMAKCSIISSGKGALPEITDIFSTYLTSVTSTEIINSVSRLIEDEDLSISLGNNVFEYAKIKFSPNKLVMKLDDKRKEYFE